MTGDQWIFAYGSLMWNPGFPFEASYPATLHGYHRSLCVYSWHYRGTASKPGLVLGLDRGGSCRGRAFRIAPEKSDDVWRTLDAREMVTAVYRPVSLAIRVHSGENGTIRANAYGYVANRAHAQYAGRLPIEEETRIIRQSRGVGGRNIDYLANTVAHLRETGIHDERLERLWRALGAEGARGESGQPHFE